eukprot:s4554_g1.t1
MGRFFLLDFLLESSFDAALEHEALERLQFNRTLGSGHYCHAVSQQIAQAICLASRNLKACVFCKASARISLASASFQVSQPFSLCGLAFVMLFC